jgi:glycerol uptake facilitator-like aquaporin
LAADVQAVCVDLTKLKNYKIKFWTIRIAPPLLGAIAGYAYYYYIGCNSGTCPLTSNPWISTIYGAVVGLLAVPWKQKSKSSQPEIENQK